MPYTVGVRTNKSSRTYTYYTRREADQLHIQYVIPPLTVETFDKREFKHVLSENDYVLPVIQWRWQRRHLERTPLEYVTPFGTAPAEGFVFCTCAPKGFIGKRRDSSLELARRFTIMARWMVMYGDAHIAYRMTYGHMASPSELDKILLDESFQVMLRNEMLNSGETLAIPMQEIIRMRLRLTSYMEDIVKRYHDDLLTGETNSASLKDFIKLFEVQKTNLVDLETGYTRNSTEGDDAREMQVSWKMRAKNLPPAKHPFLKLVPTEIDGTNVSPADSVPESLPEGFEFALEERRNENA